MKVRFTDCVELVGEAPKNYAGEKIYVSTGAVNCNEIDQAQTESVSFDNRPSRANLVVDENDILFAKMQNTHKVLLVNADLKEHIYSTGFCAVRAKEQFLTKECLFYLLNSPQFLSQKDKYCSGATQKAITNEALSKLTVNIPDMAEQEYVVKNLNKTSKLIEKRKQQLEKLDLLIKSKFDEMFGTGKFEEVPIAELVDTKIESAKTRFSSGDLIRYVDISSIDNKLNIMTGFTEYAFKDAPSRAQQCITQGDIVVSTVRPNLRNIAMNDFRYNNIVASSGFCVLRAKRCNAKFLFYAVLLDNFSRKMSGITTGANYPAIKDSDVLSYKIPNPPIELQSEFAKFVEQIDCVKLSIKHSLNKLEVLKLSLIQSSEPTTPRLIS